MTRLLEVPYDRRAKESPRPHPLRSIDGNDTLPRMCECRMNRRVETRVVVALNIVHTFRPFADSVLCYIAFLLHRPHKTNKTFGADSIMKSSTITSQIAKLRVLWLASFLLCAVSLIVPRVYAANEVVRITGTGSATGGMTLAAKAFMQKNPQITVTVLPALGSSGGINALIGGQLELAVSNRRPNEKEMAQAKLTSYEYARTPFVVAVSKTLGVSKLTNEELAALFVEGAANFPNGKRARPVMRLADATDTKLLQSFHPAVSAAIEAATTRRGMMNANTDSEAADLIEKTPGAFGASTLAQILSENRPLVALTVGDQVPSVANLQSGKYPYFKSLILISPEKPTKGAEAFMAFLKTPEARMLLGNAGHLMQ